MSEPLAQLSLQEFARQLSAKQSIPGGGAVAAVTACHAAALGCMVLSYTLGKSKFAHCESVNQISLNALHAAQAQALQLADADAQAYGTLSSLLKLPPTDAKRMAQEPDAVRHAIAAPMDILRLANDILETLQNIVQTSNFNLISDLAIAIQLADCAADAAAWNVRVNILQLAQVQERHNTQRTMEQLRDSARTRARNATSDIETLMKAK